MASSQRTVQSLFRGDIMNIWDYYEQEAKKNGLLAKRAWKIPKAIGKGFQQ